MPLALLAAVVVGDAEFDSFSKCDEVCSICCEARSKLLFDGVTVFGDGDRRGKD